MDKQRKEEKVYRVFEEIAKGYDRANFRISLGLQKSWKRMLIARVVHDTPTRGKVLDVCCGTGDIAWQVAGRRRDLAVTGIDFSPAMLKVAVKKIRPGQKNLRFLRGDAMNLPFKDETFDAATISFGLRNTADFKQVLKEMLRVVKPGGTIYCLDSVVPDCKLVLPFYQLYFRFLMPILGGGLRHKKNYDWLYQSTKHFLRRRELEKLFLKLNMKRVRTKSRMFGACVLVLGTKRQPRID